MKIVKGCIASGSVMRSSHIDELCEHYNNPAKMKGVIKGSKKADRYRTLTIEVTAPNILRLPTGANSITTPTKVISMQKGRNGDYQYASAFRARLLLAAWRYEQCQGIPPSVGMKRALAMGGYTQGVCLTEKLTSLKAFSHERLGCG